MIFRTVFLVSILVLTLIGCALSLCPDCTSQHIKIISVVPGKCDDCWPCNLLECHEGRGSSVACGTTVSHGTDIDCISCVRGVNFSDSFGSGQCQPCGTCMGKYERVHSDCNTESDVQCECEDGFYRNKTSKDCLPCASCCAGDGNIEERCRGDGGEIRKKCKFKELWPSTCLSSTSTTETKLNVSVSMLKRYSSVLVTSSSVMTTSFLHATATPLLDSITAIAPAPSETVKIKVTLASVPGHITHSKFPEVSATINTDLSDAKETKSDVKHENNQTRIILIIIVLFVVFLLVVGCAVYCIRIWKSVNNQRDLVMRFCELEAARENEERKSSECSGVSEPLLKTDEDPPGKTCKTADSSKGLFINLPEGKRDNAQLEKGIPTSLDSEPRCSQAVQRPRKRLPSEGDDKTEPCLEAQGNRRGRNEGCYLQYRPRRRGHQPNTEDYQDESAVVVVDKMLVTYHPAKPPALLNIDKPSSNDTVASNSLAIISSSNAKELSGYSPLHSEMEIHVTNQVEVWSPSAEPPIQSTEDNRGYFTHMNDVPESLLCNICMLLDEEREIDGKDYRLLASMLNQTPAQIRRLKQLQKQNGKSPSYILLMQVFSSMKNSGTLKHLHSKLESMERYDVIMVLDDWVSNNP